MSEVDLEAKYKGLQGERSTIIMRLKRLSWSSQYKPAKGEEDSDDHLQQVPSKRRRSPTASFDIETERPPVVEDPEFLRKRNKNMFHSMLGHLQRARDTLAKDKRLLDTQSKTTQKVVEELKKQDDDRREVVREELNVSASMHYPDSEETPGGT